MRSCRAYGHVGRRRRSPRPAKGRSAALQCGYASSSVTLQFKIAHGAILATQLTTLVTKTCIATQEVLQIIRAPSQVSERFPTFALYDYVAGLSDKRSGRVPTV